MNSEIMSVHQAPSNNGFPIGTIINGQSASEGSVGPARIRTSSLETGASPMMPTQAIYPLSDAPVPLLLRRPSLDISALSPNSAMSWEAFSSQRSVPPEAPATPMDVDDNDRLEPESRTPSISTSGYLTNAGTVSQSGAMATSSTGHLMLGSQGHLMTIGSSSNSGILMPIAGEPNHLMVIHSFLQHFEALPTRHKDVLLFHLLRRCEMSQLQFMSNLILPTLKRDFLTSLPPEVALNILRYLDAQSLSYACQVSRGWRFLIDHEGLLWRDLCVRWGFGSGEIFKRYSPIIPISAAAHWSPLSPSRRPAPPTPPADPAQAALAREVELHHYTWKHLFRRLYLLRGNWMAGRCRRFCWQAHSNRVVTCLQFDEDKIISGSDDYTIRIWDARTGEVRKVLNKHTGGVWALQYSGNILVSGSTDRSLRVWAIDTGECIHHLTGHTSTVRCLQIHGDLVISGSRDYTLRIWDLHSGKCLKTLRGHSNSVRCLAAVGNTLVSGSYDFTLHVWNIQTGDLIHKLAGHTQKIYSLAFDGKHIVSGSMDSTIRVWHPITGQLLHTLEGHRSLVGLLQLQDDILVSGNADATIRVWNVRTGECIHRLSGHKSAVTCLQFDDYKLITGSDNALKLWDIKTGRFVRNLVESDDVIWRIQFNETKAVVAVSRDQQTTFEVMDFDVGFNDPMSVVE